jgi:hypothetical protein
MKKLALILLIILTGSQLVKAENTPSITIEYKYKNSSDTTHFVSMRSDNEFCCNFVIIASRSENDENVTLIKHTKTGVILGTIYGKPSKKFIMDICNKMGYLDQKNVDRVANDMIKIKNK